MDRGPMRNEDIEFDELRVLDEDKEMLGVMSTDEALELAAEKELDLVVMSPDAEPPLARIMNYSKYKYEKEKKDREARKKAAAVRVDIKELKMRYNIDTHDYGVRLRAAQKFLEGGDKVKVICQFRGRENDFREIGREMFARFVEDVGEVGSLESKPSMEGNSMTMLLAPTVAKGDSK
ncbi:predicted protein [Ostreococcus lucimarinus CCE9901]|uniref:Translation initiation factor IF-3 n=1 Tax=Ostreococcus lucimarinus (strain CCE9901) TaxID=436017 RepID=A4RV10_OSTLU|nr:predicted protein [Ostreococcus lucimarinus CCE9901]ABO95055.1 predicted protein [Ostreococcus lucimarinus CCE9901]|eukprot:XP_001416762.1 predicted protein [Ostreococcus lucimarinus CCE9901]